MESRSIWNSVLTEKLKLRSVSLEQRLGKKKKRSAISTKKGVKRQSIHAFLKSHFNPFSDIWNLEISRDTSILKSNNIIASREADISIFWPFTSFLRLSVYHQSARKKGLLWTVLQLKGKEQKMQMLGNISLSSAATEFSNQWLTFKRSTFPTSIAERLELPFPYL